MSQIRAKKGTGWHPLAAELIGNEYILKMVNVSGLPKHYNGNANILSSTVAFAKLTQNIVIVNLDVTNNLLVSFDGGSNVFQIGVGEKLTLDVNINNLDISSLVDGTPYQILTVE